jgi:hypothetical protein
MVLLLSFLVEIKANRLRYPYIPFAEEVIAREIIE